LLKDGYLAITDAAKCAPLSFSDLPPDEAVAWAAVSYLFCEEDKLVTPQQQNNIIAGLESEMGGKTVDRHPVESGHAIHVSQPKTVVDVVRKALGDTA